tara:strand:- start:373 stop:1260 length:888 start_codon:yes stop_codon:yes gene_type:complete
MELSSVEHLTNKPLPWKETLIIPIGDIQLQQQRDVVDLDRLKEVIAYGVKNNAWFIGMGDFIDMESPSNRRKLRESGFYDSVVDAIDAKAEELEEELQEILKPSIGRWLGLLEGHHYHVHQDGTTTDQHMANFLKAPFLGTCAYINLTFKPDNNSAGQPKVVIWAHHGRAGGKLLSTPLNQLEHIVKAFEADIYLVGHHHKSVAGRLARIYPIFNQKVGWFKAKDIIIACTGSFLKGYLEGSKKEGRAGGLYPEVAMMNPLALGVIKLWIRPTYKRLLGTKRKGGMPTIDLNVEV